MSVFGVCILTSRGAGRSFLNGVMRLLVIAAEISSAPLEGFTKPCKIPGLPDLRSI